MRPSTKCWEILKILKKGAARRTASVDFRNHEIHEKGGCAAGLHVVFNTINARMRRAFRNTRLRPRKANASAKHVKHCMCEFSTEDTEHTEKDYM